MPIAAGSRTCDFARGAYQRERRFRTVSSFVAPYGASSKRIPTTYKSTALGLSPESHTQGPNISAGVEHSKRNRVFTRLCHRKLHCKRLMSTICDTVIRKNRYPGRTIETRVSTFH